MSEPNSSARDSCDDSSNSGSGSARHSDESYPHPAAESAAAAGEHIAGAAQEPHLDVDEMFAQLVASLDSDGLAGVESRGLAEGDAAANTPPVGESDSQGPWDFPVAPWVNSGPRDHELPEESGADTFIPPDPRDVLSGDPVRHLAWAAAVLGPVLLFVMVVVWPQGPRLILVGSLILCLSGLAVLVWRMPRDRDSDDPGAVV